MAKKIFDILPPKPLTTFQEEKPPSIPEKAKFLKKIREKVVRGKKIPLKKSLILFLSILILAGIFSYFQLPTNRWVGEARIEIWPVAEVLNFKEDLTVKVALEESDPALWVKAGAIPGKFLEEEQTLSQQFPTTGKLLKEVKAEGTIRVYNNYRESIGLVANTRFLSAEGKLFHSKERIYIPSKGFREVKVQAAEPGPDYNIKPSTFSIPGLVGYPSYTSVYGKSFSLMTGGFRGEVPQVLQNDLDQAKNILVEKLKKAGREVLVSQAEPNFILLDQALKQEVLEASSIAQAGAELEQFIFQVKLKSKALVFAKNQLENFAKEFILGQIPASKKLDGKSLKINYSPKSVDFQTGKILLSLEFSAKIYSDINFKDLKKELRGKSEDRVKTILAKKPEISKAEVKFWPFWVKKIPENIEKIKIELNLDPAPIP